VIPGAVSIWTYFATTTILGGALAGVGYQHYRDETPADDHLDDDNQLDPPHIKRTFLEKYLGLLSTYRHQRKRRKLAGKGYVQWYLVDSGWPRPRYIKPEDEGGGEFEYEYDDETYLFPTDALVPNRDSGLWTVVHQRGNAVPINVSEPSEFSVSAKQLHDYVTSRVTIEPPGWLSDIEAGDLIKYAIFGFIALILLQGAFSGGLPMP
jgi:hypothetical protein